MTAAVEKLHPELSDYPLLPVPDLALLRGRDAGNRYLAAIEVFGESPEAKRMTQLGEARVWLLARAWVAEAERRGRERVAPPPPPATADESMRSRVDAQRDAVEVCERHLAEVRATAASAASRVSQLVAAKRSTAEIESARGEHGHQLLAVEGARDELAAARAELDRLREQAADPERQRRLARLQAATDRAGLRHFHHDSTDDVELLQAIGAELERARRRMVDRLNAAQAARHEAFTLADQLEVPRPDVRPPEIGDVRVAMRRALAAGVKSAGGRPQDFERIADLHHA